MAIPPETQWRNAAGSSVSPRERLPPRAMSTTEVTQSGASTTKVDTPRCLRTVFIRSGAVAFPVVVLLATLASCLVHARVLQLEQLCLEVRLQPGTVVALEGA